MMLYPVQSSHLVSVGYALKTETMYITYWEGSAYSYAEVPIDVFLELKDSPSHGKYLWANIRRGQYEYQRLPYSLRI